MRKLLLATTAVFALSGAAFAADLPARYAPVASPVAPVFTWTGLYGGLTVGYASQRESWDNLYGTYGGGPSRTVPGNLSSMSDRGGMAGTTLGYNYQIGSIVLGVEFDWQFTNLDSSSICFGNNSSYSATCGSKLKSFGTLTGRLGFTPWSGAMAYLKGGAAYGSFQRTVGNFVGFSDPAYDTQRTTQWGWTIGGGVEQMITSNLSAKIEAQYIDFGKKRRTFTSSTYTNDTCYDCYNAPFGTDVKSSAFVVKAGLNYKFNLFGGAL